MGMPTLGPAKILLFVGSDRNKVLGRYQQMVSGVPGHRRNRREVGSVASLYEAGSYLASLREFQPDPLPDVFVIVTDTALEVMDPSINLKARYSSKDHHFFRLLFGNNSRIKAPYCDFLYGVKAEGDIANYIWEDYSDWKEGDPRESHQSSALWLEFNMEHFSGGINTIEKAAERLLPRVIRDPDIEGIRYAVEQFYSTAHE